MIISGTRINWGRNYFGSVLIAAVYLCLHLSGYYDFYLRAIATLGLIPVVSAIIILVQTKEIRMAVIALVLYQTWNMFLEPYTWQLPIESLFRTYDRNDFPLMALFSSFSIWSLYIGCLYGIKKIHSQPIFSYNKMTIRQIEVVLLLLIIGGFVLQLVQTIISFFEIPFGFLSLIETMLPATIGAVALLYWLRGGRKLIYIILTILYIIYYFIYYVGGTLFVYSIFLVVAPTIIYIIERKKIPYKTVIIIVILLMPIYMTRHTYRTEGLHSSGAARMAIGLKILQHEYQDINVNRWTELYRAQQENYNVDNRMEGVSYLGTIIHSINSGQSQYVWGKTMAWLPTMILPHFLVPFRPSQNMGTEWAVYYGVKDPSWQASINFPMLCEFYVNFGYWGMVILSFFNGLLIIWFMKKFNNGVGDTNLLLLIFVITKIIVVEANVTLAYGAILQVMFVCWLIKRLIRIR